MERLHKKIVKALKSGLPDFGDALDVLPDAERITGFVVSSAFNRKDHPARQKILWNLLERALTKEELVHLGPIATLTPAEATVKAE